METIIIYFLQCLIFPIIKRQKIHKQQDKHSVKNTVGQAEVKSQDSQVWLRLENLYRANSVS